jgi:3-deoxy-D-manno-octulosonic-acid transferase
VVTGPHTFNFDLAARLAVQAGAAVRVSDMAQAVVQAAELAADGTRLEQVRQRARRFAAAHQGAAAATASAIAALLHRA